MEHLLCVSPWLVVKKDVISVFWKLVDKGFPGPGKTREPWVMSLWGFPRNENPGTSSYASWKSVEVYRPQPQTLPSPPSLRPEGGLKSNKAVVFLSPPQPPAPAFLLQQVCSFCIFKILLVHM